MKKSAFTLIELLVVIAIIALLASIAMPVFSKVLERGKVSSDGNNLHQIGVAIAAYLADNDDQLFSTAGGAAGATWPVALHDKYIPNWKTFLSPFDKRPPTETGSVPISYGINQNAFRTNASKWTSPSQLIIMAPNVALGKDLTFTGTSMENPTITTPGGGAKNGTHSGRSQINALFADAHVENMAYRKFADTGSPEGMKAWYPEGQPAAAQ